MIRLHYRCHGFGPSYGRPLRGAGTLRLEWNDLVWAAVSVGKLGYDDLMGHGPFSFDEIRFRAYLIYSHLMQDGNQVCKSPLYESLDSTEKGAASYFIGMALAKIVGAFLLNIPWLVHLEKIKALYGVAMQGKSRPDLLGLNSKGEWIVFEAKGRSQGFSQYALDKAKSQTGYVRSVSGLAPALRVATESFFDPYLRVRVVDPQEPNDEAIHVKISEAQFLSSYYSTFMNMLQYFPQTEIEQNEQPYSFAENESAGMSLGMHQHVLDRLRYGDIRTDDFQSISWSIEEVRRTDKRSTKYYPDGLAVTLDDNRWSTEIMSLNPSKRIS